MFQITNLVASHLAVHSNSNKGKITIITCISLCAALFYPTNFCNDYIKSIKRIHKGVGVKPNAKITNTSKNHSTPGSTRSYLVCFEITHTINLKTL